MKDHATAEDYIRAIDQVRVRVQCGLTVSPAELDRVGSLARRLDAQTAIRGTTRT